MFNSSAFPYDSPPESLRWVDFEGNVRRKFVGPAHPRLRSVSDHVAFSPDGRIAASAEREQIIVLYEMDTGLPRRILHGHRGQISEVAFTPDGRRLVTFNSDLTGLVWDLTLAAQAEGTATEDNLRAAWDTLSDRMDGRKVQKAMALLASAPVFTLAIFKQGLRPVPHIDRKHIARLVAELASADFTVRSKATAALNKLGEDAWPFLVEHLKAPGSLETGQRLRRLIKEHDPHEPSNHRLRELRAVEVLEQLGTPGSRDLLRSIAAGAATSRLTKATAASHRRMERR